MKSSLLFIECILSFLLVFSQSSSGGFPIFDYAGMYTHNFHGSSRDNTWEKYTLPKDSLVFGYTIGDGEKRTSNLYVNGIKSPKILRYTDSGTGGGNHSTSWSNNNYVSFAFCKKGDVISAFVDRYTNWEVTIIPVRE